MAKKSNGGMLKMLLDIGTILFGALVLVFMAIPYLKSVLAGNIVNDSNAMKNGFALIDFEENSVISSGVAVTMLILMIVAIVLIVAGALKLIADLGIVKNKSFTKIIGFAGIISAVLTVVMAIVAMIVISNFAADNYVEALKTGLVVNWLPLILNLVLGICATATTFLASRK